MYTVQFTVLAVLSILGRIECTAGDPPVAGKCRSLPYVKLNQEEFGKLAAISQYNVIYATDNPPYNKVAQEKRALTHLGENLFHLVDTRTYKDQTTDAYSYNATYMDFVGYEVSTGANGVQREYRIYVLAICSDDRAVLYYRCSDDGDPTLDTRAIEIAAGKTLSEAGLNYLLEKDSTFGFTHGTLKKLPQNGQY